MKKILVLGLVSSIHFSYSQTEKRTVSADGRCGGDAWELAFEDNFDGSALNTNVWANRGYSQGALDNDGTEEYYTLDNVQLENGICKLIPKKETIVRKAVSWEPDSAKMGDGRPNTRTFYHTSAWIETKEKFRYGKYEIRCKIPKGKSLWPAFWMYGEVNGMNNEIDVFEFWNPQNSIGRYKPSHLSMEHHMTVHYNHKMSGKSYVGPDFSADFHTFTVVWDSTKIEWYVDGSLKRTVTQYMTKRGKNISCDEVKAGKTYYLNPIFPRDPMAILANIAVQSGKNAPDESTFAAPVFEIDYIRYYKPK
ncbi:MAG: family 16 glycosylhydrolase [Bacteroidia bacterium]